MKELKKNILNILKQNKNKKYNHIQISSVLGIYDPKQRKKIIRIIQNLIEQNIKFFVFFPNLKQLLKYNLNCYILVSI